MIYQPFGKTGISLSKLGFGSMRLPMREDGDKKTVDYDLSTPLLQRAFELGVNYVDTAPYYCESDSEVAVGKALKGWRDKVYLSTKNPVEDSSGDHWRRRLETSLKKLDTDHIDFYHMWGINLKEYRDSIDVKDGPLEAAHKALDEGLIRYLSFSFHDDPANMLPILDSGEFTSVLCQYNLLDQANTVGMEHAKELGMGVVIMGPVGGGRLGGPSPVLRSLIQRETCSSAEIALRFVLANPNVNIALSGMENLTQLEENVKVASVEGPLSAEEYARVQDMIKETYRLRDLYCTGCKYCMPCPQGVNIPHVFSLMNYHRVYDLTDYARNQFALLHTPVADRKEDWAKQWGEDPAVCVECAQCESRCPQKLKIIEQLKETRKALG